MSVAPPEIAEELTRLWTQSFEQLLASMTSQEYSVNIGQPDPAEPAAEQPWMWWTQEFNVLTGPGLWVGASGQIWEALGASILSALGVDESTPEDSQAAAKDLLAQTTSALVQELTTKFDTEVSCRDLTPADPPDGQGIEVTITGDEKLGAVKLRLVFHDALVGAFAGLESGEEIEPQQESSAPAESEHDHLLKAFPKPLTDLKLRVEINLGKTSLPLRNILRLAVGGVINLEQLLSDLVEVSINDRVLAIGRVVVCNGSYAVEIIRRVSRDERESNV